jgi:TP901 family phage tail tape measure protein
MTDKLHVALILSADPRGLDAGLRHGSASVKGFTAGVKRELELLGNAWKSTLGRVGQLGLGLGAGAALTQSARLDRDLLKTKQTAGATKSEMAGLRGELFAMAKQTGANVEDLKAGDEALIASGQSWKAALEDIKAINIAMGVTGADATTLAGGLTVAGEAFQFDLEKPGLALELLDKMTVAGRQGNAELENLADIFARVGVNASSAGLGFEKTLGFVEALSLVERQPERLATLADSTLRLFNNVDYMQTAEQASNLAGMLLKKRRGDAALEAFPDKKERKKLAKAGTLDKDFGGVKFFDDKGGRRDPVAVLKDLREQFKLLRTDQERSDYLGNVFDKMDLDTVKGLKTLLQGDALDKIGAFETAIKGGVGTLKKDLPEALSNAVDQAGRLKNTLREAADGFAKPINAAMSDLVKFGLDKKELSGGELLAGGAALAAGAYVGGRVIKGVAGKLLGGGASLGAGVAVGKGLQEAAGVTPVFVVNMPAGGMGGAGTVPEPLAGKGGAGGGAAAAARFWPTLGQIGVPLLAAGGLAYGLAKATAGADRPGTYLHNPKDKAGDDEYLREQKWREKNFSWWERFKEDSKFGDARPRPGSEADAMRRGGNRGGSADLYRSHVDQGRITDALVRPLVGKALGDLGIAKWNPADGLKELAAAQDRSASAIERTLQSLGGDLQGAINNSNLADRIGQMLDAAVAGVAAKKADLTIKIDGPGRVVEAQSTGFSLNINSGILPVGR